MVNHSVLPWRNRFAAFVQDAHRSIARYAPDTSWLLKPFLRSDVDAGAAF